MITYILRRLAVALLLVLIISFISFLLFDLAPGDPVRELMGPTKLTPSPDTIAAIRAEYHLNGSVFARYGGWLWDALHLRFGRSFRTNELVTAGLMSRAGLTLQLAGLGFLIVLAVGLPLGTIAAIKKDSRLDRIVVSGSVLALSSPPFVTSLILLEVFAIRAHLLPAFGAGSGGFDRLRHLILPAIALSLSSLAVIVRMTRVAMIRELDQDYVVFAQARAISWGRIVTRYALRNALIPVLTVGGLVLAYMITAAVLAETAFSFSGLGSLLVASASARDLPMMQAVVLFMATAVVVINFLVDILYGIVDPRVRVGGPRSA